MHPNAFLKTYWRTEVVDKVFVAMSFDTQFTERYEKVIQPAIEDAPICGINLKAYRVDNSKTGDSILTDIVDGIAHSRLVLADVSSIDVGKSTGKVVRNGNVMYEVGVALASRLPSEVLLVRDDNERFLFDVSTIPHVTVDFTDRLGAIESIRVRLEDRIVETERKDDARVRMALGALTEFELYVLSKMAEWPENQIGWLHNPNPFMGSMLKEGLHGLISKGCVRSEAVNPEDGKVFYRLNRFGRELAESAESHLRKMRADQVKETKVTSSQLESGTSGD